MKIFGLHWAAHLVYLAALAGGFYFGKNKLEEIAFLQAEIGQTQGLSLPEIRRSNEWVFKNINKNAYAYRTPKNEENGRAARQARNLVDRFSEKCELVRQRLNNGTKPAQIDWPVDLLADYYLLGDSLKIILPPDTSGRAWLDRCLFDDYAAYPSSQLAGWLAIDDTSQTGLLLQNLQLRAELALRLGLNTLLKQMKTDDIKFDALLPVFTYTDCPRAGQPFEAEVYLAPYFFHTENLRVKVNGQLVPMEKGLAHYRATFNDDSPPALAVEIVLTNPLTGEMKIYRKAALTSSFN